MAGFTEQILEEIRTKSDILDIVSEYVAMKHRGKNYVGLCPFHAERTPSFNVVPDKQIFHCFGCGAGGDVFRFIQMRENLSFPEAVRHLAERAGVSLEESLDPAERRRLREQEQVRQALDWAAKFFAYELHQPSGARALEYLRGRGLSEATIEHFMLGYATDNWDGLLKRMTRRGFEPEILLKAGLVQPRSRGDGHIDRFRHRVMFPIRDIRGRVIGFGGRALEGDQEPKYLNSPESAFFDKGRNLYALHLAKAAVREQDRAVIVEGYMDAIACHQAGVTNVVASLGTALTADQGRLLQQQAAQVVIAYDSDTAGQNATLRGLEILGGMGFQVSVLSLPEGKDPDEFLRGHPPEEFGRLVEGAQPLVEFRLSQALRRFGSESPEAKSQVVRAALPVLASLADEVRRGEYIRWLGGRLGIHEEDLRLDLKKFLARRSGPSGHSRGKSWHNSEEVPAASNQEPRAAPVLPEDRLKAERLAVQLLLQVSDLIQAQAGFTATLLEHPQYRRIAEAILAEAQTPGSAREDRTQRALARLQSEEDLKVATTLLASSRPAGDATRSLSDCIHTIEQHILRRRLAELHVVIEKSTSEQERLVALQEYQQLVRQTKRPKIISQ